MEVDQEVLGLLSKVGHYDLNSDGSEIFVAEERPLKTLRDIRRILSKDLEDDDEFSSRTLADVQAIRQHLVPLLISCEEIPAGDVIVDEVIKLFVLLTLPETPCHELHANALRLTFVEFARAGTPPLLILLSAVESALATDASKRSELDRKRIDLLLYFVRNLLLPSSGAIGREAFILELEKEAGLDLIIHFTQHIGRKNNREWNLLLLEIFFNIFRGSSADELMAFQSTKGVNSRVSTNGRKSESNETKRLLEGVRQQKRSMNKFVSSRHSNFGGAFQTVGGETSQRIIPSIFSSFENKRITADSLPLSMASRRRRVQDHSAVQRDVLDSKVELSITGWEFGEVLKRIANELVDRSYGTLFESLIQDIRREDTRIKREDEVRYIWMMKYFTRYARLRGRWSESTLMMTMDLWSFQYVISRIAEHLENKAWASLETSVEALHEMVLNLKNIHDIEIGVSLRNAVLYELRERLEIVPRLLKIWEPMVLSRPCLANLAEIADVLLEIIEDMAEEGAVAKATLKARLKAERRNKNASVFNLVWSGEETHALAEGVKARGGAFDLATMKDILKDRSVGPVFEDMKRTPQQLLARWIQVRSALQSGKTLDQFVRDDLEREIIDDNDDEQGAEQRVKDVIGEKQIDFFGALRSYISNNVFRNLTRLFDPALHPDSVQGILQDSATLRIVAKFIRRLRAFKKGLKSEESLEPLLWHLENLEAWRRFLTDVFRAPRENRTPESLDLCNLLMSSIRRMLRLADKQKNLLIELAFWRTKQDNVLISRNEKSNVKMSIQPPSSEFEATYEDELRELDMSNSSEDEEGQLDDDDIPHKDINGTSKVENEAKISSSKLVSTAITRSAMKKSSKSKPKHERSRPIHRSQQHDETAVKIFTTHALKAGVAFSTFLALVHAFEVANEEDEDTPFLLNGDWTDMTKQPMIKLMLALGMSPPNGDIKLKKRSRFGCQAYWRLPNRSKTKAEFAAIAELIRSSMLTDLMTTEASEDDGDSLSWCLPDNTLSNLDLPDSPSDTLSKESTNAFDNVLQVDDQIQMQRKRRVYNTSSDSESESDSEDNSERHLPSLQSADPLAKAKRRRVVSDDDED